MIGRAYTEGPDGPTVVVLARWDHRGLGVGHGSPRNVLVRRARDDRVYVRSFRGLRRLPG